MSHPRSLAAGARIAELDMLRGIAVLGMLGVNLQLFALPYVYSLAPTLPADHTPLDAWLWLARVMLADGTFRAMFSMLFGAGAIIFLLGDGDRLSFLRLRRFARRNLFLILVGSIHGYLLLWVYDILFPYGLIGFFIMPLVLVRPPWLLLGAVLLMAFGMLQDLGAGAEERELYARGAMDLLERREEIHFEVLMAEAEEDVAHHRKPYWEMVADASPSMLFHQETVLDSELPDIATMMLIGMALYRWGVLTGRRSRTFYAWLALGSGLVATGVNGWEGWVQLTTDFGMMATDYWAPVTNDVGRGALAICYVSVLMLVRHAPVLAVPLRALARVGKLAITNYVMQTAVCQLLFIGLGLFGRIPAPGLVLVMVAIWVLQIVFSRYWLARFEQGPLEWAMRSASHWQLMPWRRAAPAT